MNDKLNLAAMKQALAALEMLRKFADAAICKYCGSRGKIHRADCQWPGANLAIAALKERIADNEERILAE